VRLALAGLLLANSLTPTDNWWLDERGFADTGLDGSGVTIAVIDTGIEDSHTDLVGTVLGGVDLSGVGTPDGTTPVGTSAFHATMVASLIAGQGSPESGVLGVAPGAGLLSISIGLGVKGADTDAQIASAVIWAVDNGAHIINLSLSRNSQSWPTSWDEAFQYAFENDVIVVAAAGNRTDGSGRPSAPATIPGVIAVGGVTRDLQPSESVVEGYQVSVVAPAEDLYGSYPGEAYRSWGGSSAAAPLVTGLLALMKQADSEAKATDLIQRLLESAIDLGEPGIDAAYGHGLIDPKVAIAATSESDVNPLGSLSRWVELYRSSTSVEDSGLAEPENPSELPDNSPTMSATELETEQTSDSQARTRARNGLIYWLLLPLAPALWFVLRRVRKDKVKATKKIKGMPHHDSSDH